MIHGKGNMLGIRDKSEHSRKKRIFCLGFSDSALRNHEPKVLEMINLFCENIGDSSSNKKNSDGWSTAKDMTGWCESNPSTPGDQFLMAS